MDERGWGWEGRRGLEGMKGGTHCGGAGGRGCSRPVKGQRKRWPTDAGATRAARRGPWECVNRGHTDLSFQLT